MAKYKSRAARAGACASDLQSIAACLRECIPDKEIKNKKKQQDIIEQANSIIGDVDFSEVENLLEEVSSWRDNLQGTGLENTNKYSMLDEAVGVLESIDCNIDEVTDISEIEDRADELDEKASELESVEFPGMYS